MLSTTYTNTCQHHDASIYYIDAIVIFPFCTVASIHNSSTYQYYINYDQQDDCQSSIIFQSHYYHWYGEDDGWRRCKTTTTHKRCQNRKSSTDTSQAPTYRLAAPGITTTVAHPSMGE